MRGCANPHGNTSSTTTLCGRRRSLTALQPHFGPPLTEAGEPASLRYDTTGVEGTFMADQRYPVRRSRGFVGPVLGGLAIIAALIAGIAFRRELWRFVRWAGAAINDWLTGCGPGSSPSWWKSASGCSFGIAREFRRSTTFSGSGSPN